MFPWGKAPEIDMSLQNEPVYRTRNLTRSPFMVTIERAHDNLFDYKSKYRSYYYWWHYYNEKGVNINFLRVKFQNPTSLSFRNIYVMVQHFAGSHKAGHHRGTSVRGKGYPHSTELYELGGIKPNAKFGFDTQGVEFRFDREGWHRGYYYYQSHIERGENIDYAGYIISFLDSKNNLLLQMTNNKQLDEKGLKKIPPEILNQLSQVTED